MLISRTPFRISLGGGSTDLPSYCEQYGGFIFGVSIKMYMDIFVRTPIIYDKIDLQYLKFESVDFIDQLQHPIGKEALKIVGLNKAVSIYFKSDTPMGTGLGSSGACAVGLLNVLWRYKGIIKMQEVLAEEAFQITQRLGLPDGRQDPYLAALGDFTALELGADDSIAWYHPNISRETIQQFLDHSLFFYTGVRRDSVDVLRDQNHIRALELKHRTKEIGRQILIAFENGLLDDFGYLMNEHWQLKKEMSDKISSPEFDAIYAQALQSGALGGKLIGAGGGGYFFFYCRDKDSREQTSIAMQKAGFKEIPFDVDYAGTRTAEILI